MSPLAKWSVLLFLIALVALLVGWKRVPSKPQVIVGDTTFTVELANTPEKRAQGLSGRKELSQNTGMLFIFDQQDIKPTFWMKDMLIPIDIIWINDGKVLQIDENVPPPEAGTPNSSLKLYPPKEPIDYVLEVNAGVSRSITLGQAVELKLK